MEKIIDMLKTNLDFNDLRKTTYRRYMYCIIKFLEYVNSLSSEINLEKAREFLNYLRKDKKLSIGTVNDYRSSIKYLFEVVLDKGWNDRKVPRLKGYNPLPTILSKTEVKNILNSVDNIVYRTLLTTVYSSGLRIQEAINLKVSDIDSKRMQLYIRESKNGSARYAILSEKNLETLRSYFKTYWLKKFGKYHGEDYIFCVNKKCSPVTARTIRTALVNAAIKAGIHKKVTIHTLRHSFATHLLESDTNLFTIKQLLGHKSIRSTCIYLHVVDMQSLGAISPFDS